MTSRNMQSLRKTALLAATGAFLVACSTDGDTSDRATGTVPAAPATGTVAEARPDEVPYAFDQPLTAFALPDELTEISGLTELGDGRLAAVQDEDGILFLLDAETGSITDRITFGKGGDHEGIELVGERLFVLFSNGNLLELSGWNEGELETNTHKTDLKAKNDTEGLTYDAANRRLLIVTKEDPGSGLDKDREKAIYAFDPESGELTEDPAFVLDTETLESAISGLKSFKPSALAVHPQTGDVYVLSSTSQALVALGADGEIRHAWRLDPSLFEQPEGLAFSPEGDLFISSEGVDGPAMLYRFTEQP